MRKSYCENLVTSHIFFIVKKQFLFLFLQILFFPESYKNRLSTLLLYLFNSKFVCSVQLVLILAGLFVLSISMQFLVNATNLNLNTIPLFTQMRLALHSLSLSLSLSLSFDHSYSFFLLWFRTAPPQIQYKVSLFL